MLLSIAALGLAFPYGVRAKEVVVHSYWAAVKNRRHDPGQRVNSNGEGNRLMRYHFKYPASPSNNRRRLGGAIRISSLLLVVIGAVLSLLLALWLFSPSVRKATTLGVAEIAGNVAEGYMADTRPVEVIQIADIVFQATGIANTQLIPTSEGYVVFDTGLSIQAAKQKRLLEEAAGIGPITEIILSHSHQDHVGGVSFWLEDDSEIIAHAEFEEEQRYLKELEPYLWTRNRRLFPWMPEEPVSGGPLEFGKIEPTLRVDGEESLTFERGGIRFEVIPTPGAEGADNLCLWLPDQKILLSGDFFGPIFPQFPNIFTMRGEKTRKPIEYIRSLDRLIALEPEIVIPSHLSPAYGREEIKAAMTRMRDAVQFVHDATVEGMNSGRTVYELMEEIELPPELELSQIHGKVSWGVKSIWEYYATWFHHDSTTELYAVPARSLYGELAELAGPEKLVARGRAYLTEGKPVESLHFSEIVLEADPNSRSALELHRDALEELLARARKGHQNAFELGWLGSRLGEIRARLELAAP